MKRFYLLFCMLFFSLFFKHGYGLSVGEEWIECRYEGKQRFYKADSEACCQGEILVRSQIREEICCGNKLYDSSSGACCGATTWYDQDTQLCCNSQVYPISEDRVCCNDQALNTTTHTCCLGQQVEGTGECCGQNSVYDRTTQHCCIGHDNTGYVSTVGREAILSDTLECCDNQTIDVRHKLCCGRIARERETPFSECCGPVTFDTRTDVCCGGYGISPLVEGRVECCHLTPYNKDNEQCCQATVTPNIGNGKCCGKKAYNPRRASCCDPYGDNPVSLSIPEIPGVQDCCEGQSYLKTQKVCCSGTLHDLQPGMECCGMGLYMPTDSLCCGEQVMEKPSATAQCCGNNDVFDPERQTCCNGHVISDIVSGSCCRIGEDRYEAYDPERQKCCERRDRYGPTYGLVHSISTKCCGSSSQLDSELCNHCAQKPILKTSPGDNAVCCGTRRSRPQTYNTTTKICKDGRVLTKRLLREGEQRCDKSPYNTATHQCCRLRVHPKMFDSHPSLPMKCCGIEAYVPAWHSCLNNFKVVKGIPEKFASMCRGQVYNNKTHVCDVDNLLVLTIADMERGLEVCKKIKAGYDLYDPEEKQCCDGSVISAEEPCCVNGRSGTGRWNCCGSTEYDPDTHICCDDDILHQITAQGQVCCGRQLYDRYKATKLCCNGTLYSTADGRTQCTAGVAHRPTDTVCDGVVHPVQGGQCCGKELMDSNLQICCQDFLYDRIPGAACCGRVVYNSLDVTKKCCADSLFHDAQNSVCCDNQLMDSFREICQAVGGIRYSLPRFRGIIFCREGEYDSSRQTCCQGLLYDFVGECCGNEVIPESQSGEFICCNGTKKERGYGESSVCCGGEVIDERKYSCCGNSTLKNDCAWKTCCNGVITGRGKCQKMRRLPSDLQLPVCGGQLYNSSTQGCCDDKLYDSDQYGCLDNMVKPLCGGIPYSNDSTLCCSGQAHNASTTGCCNGMAYDRSRYTCCTGQLTRMRNGACCGPDSSMPYNSKRHICCDGTLRKRKKGRSECCGTSAYNPDTDTCCEGRVIRDVPRGNCCGTKLFDPAKKMCCPSNGTLYRRRPGLTGDLLQGCCDPGMEYSTESGTCIPQVCEICRDLTSTDEWRQHVLKPTLIRGTATNITNTTFHDIIHLTRVSHLNHDKRQARVDSRELDLVIPTHCGCHSQFQLDKAYVIMADASVSEGQDSKQILLQSTDFLARAKNKLGSKIKRRLCRIDPH